MICLIFTRKKLLVGVQGKITEFLRFSGKPYIDYTGQRMYDIFDKYFPKIIEEFLIYTKKNQLALQESTPIVVSFPSETYQTPAGQQTIKDIEYRIEETISPAFTVVANKPIHIAYLKGLQLQNNVLDEGCVILEAIDGLPSLIYIYHPEDGLENGHIIPIQKIGVNGSSQSLLQALELEFGKMGLTLDQDDRASLLDQIQQQPAIETFVLDKSYGAARMKLEVSRSSLQVGEPMLIYQNIFDEWLSEAKLEALNTKRVFLVGENLKRGIIRNYIDERINGESGIELIEHVRTHAIWKFIVKGALDSIPQEYKVGIVNGSHHSGNPFSNRRNGINVFSNPEEAYKQYPVPNKESEKDPYVDEMLKGISEAPVEELYQQVNLNNYPESQIEQTTRLIGSEIDNHSWMSRLGFEGNTYTINKASQDFSLYEMYNVIKKWEHSPFNNYEVQDKVNQGKFILKYISNDELDLDSRKSAFYYLFEKEKAYFGFESSLSLSKEGLYYLRPFVKGQTLGKIIHENKMDEKRSLADFNSKDLKLIVAVLETTQALNISHTEINENNILIFKGRNWSFRREYFATFVGFSVEDCSVEDMIGKVHDIFEQRLRAGVYQQIRQILEI